LDLFDSLEGFCGEDLKVLESSLLFHFFVGATRRFLMPSTLAVHFVKSRELLGCHVWFTHGWILVTTRAWLEDRCGEFQSGAFVGYFPFDNEPGNNHGCLFSIEGSLIGGSGFF
jgi:hypothetical protein